MRSFNKKEVIPVVSGKQDPEETWCSIYIENSHVDNIGHRMFVIACH